MDNIKEAFQKVKYDIDSLKKELGELKNLMIQLSHIVKKNSDFIETNNAKNLVKTSFNQTNNSLFKPLNDQNLHISTGNEGVPTDRQTNQQTDRQAEKRDFSSKKPFDEALELLNSLDNIKKELRLKFKRLTEKEFLVFSTLYELQDIQEKIYYKDLSLKLNLTESSIRDYIGKLIKKGIPVDKFKENNKNVRLSISHNLRKLATLPTILQLRDL